jgi:methionine synthase II (cobalamin-independent)
MIPTQADIVGSLLRPTELLAAQKQLAARTITADEFKEIENRAVTAMLDRLLHHGHVLKCGPRSWRTKMDLPDQEAKR